MKNVLKDLKVAKVLDLLIWARINTEASQSEFNRRANEAYDEATKAGFPELILIIISHIGDISRRHNLFKGLGIKSSSGGGGEYNSFRKLSRWLVETHPEIAGGYYKYAQEFTQYSVGWFYQNTTDRKTGKLLTSEQLFYPEAEVFRHVHGKLMRNEDISIIAKQLPKYVTGSYRYTKQKDGSMKKRAVKEHTVMKRKTVNAWINRFIKAMAGTTYFVDGSLSEYRRFRKLQDSMEQKLSTKMLENYAKDELYKIFDACPAGQRSRLHCIMQNPESSFPKASNVYKEWMGSQEKVASMTKEERKEAGVKLTVKATGMKTIDIFARMIESGDTGEADTLWKSLVEKQKHETGVFPVIDGSGSMDNKLDKYPNLSVRDAAYAMAVTFATQNPNEKLRNSFGWFSENFHVINHVNYKYDSSSYWNRHMIKVKPFQVLSEKYTFSQNMSNLKASCSGEISCTDQVKVVEYFVQMVNENKLRVEELPGVLLYLTDNEFNGRYNAEGNVIKSQQVAATVGWYPLQVLWGLRMAQQSFPFTNISNCIGLGGFNEGLLSQVFNNIMSAYVDPHTELWSIANDSRYSMFPSKELKTALNLYFS